MSVPTRYRLNDKQGKMGNCLSNYGHNISHRYWFNTTSKPSLLNSQNTVPLSKRKQCMLTDRASTDAVLKWKAIIVWSMMLTS